MGRPPKIKIESNKIDNVAPVVETQEFSVSNPVVDEWPQTGQRGYFHSVPFKEGFVVFNPQCQRITEVVSKIKADDIVRTSNLAAGIKIRK